MFLILEGEGELRFGDQRYAIRKHDVIACPTGGPEVAHQIINTGTSTMRYLALSTLSEVDVCEYPDSQKVLVVTGQRGDDGLRKIFRAENTVRVLRPGTFLRRTRRRDPGGRPVRASSALAEGRRFLPPLAYLATEQAGARASRLSVIHHCMSSGPNRLVALGTPWVRGRNDARSPCLGEQPPCPGSRRRIFFGDLRWDGGRGRRRHLATSSDKSDR
jgi:hypothetical protein